MQIALGLLLTGGIGIGLVRLGTMIEKLGTVVDAVRELRGALKDFKIATQQIHNDLSGSVTQLSTDLAVVQATVSRLPCTTLGSKPLKDCP